MIFACILAFAAAKPGSVYSVPAAYAAPLAPGYAYAASPLTYSATYSRPLAYAAPYAYSGYNYNYRAPALAYSALPAAYIH